MSEIVTAVFEQGVLRPTTPLSLREHETVRIRVLRSDAPEEVEAVLRSLAKGGVVTPPSAPIQPDPSSDAERTEAARALGSMSGEPLSQRIMDERGD